MEISGRLATISLGDVLQWAQNDRWNGALVLRRREREKRIYLTGGKVAGCLSDEPGEFYGRHLRLNGHVGEHDLARALTHCTDRHQPLGASLAELGILSPDDVRETLGQQIFDAVCGAFLWTKGVFYLESLTLRPTAIDPEPLDTFHLVMEGNRWIDEHARIRRLLVHDRVVLRRGARPAEGLGPLERHVVEAVDGESDLAELHVRLGGSQFRFLDAAHRLCLAEVLDIARIDEADLTATGELSMLDVLLEQAAIEERARLAEGHLAVSLEILERLVPAWVVRPTDSELTPLEPGGRRLFRSIDGRTRLADLLSPDPTRRLQQAEALLVELGRGRLALLPVPREELPE